MLTALHFLTHIGQSWLVANLVPGSRKDRWLVILAGVALDLDGAGILWNDSAYRALHRAAGHGALAALVLIGLAVLAADRPLRTGALAALSFHLHLLLDVVGTGGLPIRYWWPASDRGLTYDGHWRLASWQNALVMAFTALAVLTIALRSRRSRRHTLQPPPPPAYRVGRG